MEEIFDLQTGMFAHPFFIELTVICVSYRLLNRLFLILFLESYDLLVSLSLKPSATSWNLRLNPVMTTNEMVMHKTNAGISLQLFFTCVSILDT